MKPSIFSSSSFNVSILGPVLFNTFINDLDGSVECSLSKFVECTNLREMADSTKGSTDIQRDLDRLERWADKNLVKFNKKYSVVIRLITFPCSVWSCLCPACLEAILNQTASRGSFQPQPFCSFVFISSGSLATAPEYIYTVVFLAMV